MKRAGVLLILTSMLVFTLQTLTVSAEPLENSFTSVPHPRLILSREILARIQAEVRSKPSTDFRELLAYAHWRENTTSSYDLSHRYFQPEIILPLSLAALLSEEKQLIGYAADSIAHLAGIAAETGNDTDQRMRLLSLSIGFDWLYEHFSPADRAKITGSISSHLRLLGYFANSPKFTGGHDRFGSIALLAGAVAVAGERGAETNALLVDKLRRQWSDGYNPFQAFAARGGGYVMGWQYGAGYTSLWPYLIGERLGLDWLTVSWLSDLPLWYIYGLRSDGTFPRLGDCDDTRVGQHLAPLMAYASERWSDGLAEWFYRTRLASLWGPYRIWRIIFPGTGRATPPDSADNSLPLARHFSGSGVVVARNAWDGASTHLVFKSSPFYSLNHQHKDQNHFELSYKGSLLVDSGCYDRYGSSHWKNYYTRTIAHNSLVVFSVNSEYTLDSKKLSNDGGQIFRKFSVIPRGEEPNDLAEALSGKYRLDGISGFASTAQGVWMQGNATKAYNDTTVKSYLRDIVMVYKPQGRKNPLIIILDRVTLAVKLIPRILFHSNDKPVVKERLITVANTGGGVLHGEFFSDCDLRVSLIGGPGQEWLVNGINYPPERLCGGSEGTDPGSWRLEVGPTEPVGTFELLTVLTVDDKTDSEGVPKYVRVTGEGYRGIVTGNEFIVIVSGVENHDLLFEGKQFESVDRVMVAGSYTGSVVRINGRVVPVSVLADNSAALNTGAQRYLPETEIKEDR